MISIAALKDLLHKDDLSNIDRFLLCLAAEPMTPRSVAQIREIALLAGLTQASRTNISALLGRAKNLAIRTPDGWELTTQGKAHIGTITGPYIGGPVAAVATSLRAALGKVADPHTRAFAEEAVQCFENRFFRAAVVLSWVGAVSLLYDFVVAKRLVDFNSEAARREPKWKDARNKDDLARLKEYDFLQILSALGVLAKNVKEELEGCLKFRNACGHPTSLKFGEHRVSSHIETLILNVFSVF